MRLNEFIDRMDNELVRQKNALLAMINDGQLQQAYQILKFVAPLWRDFSYGYKTGELARRMLVWIEDAVGTLDVPASTNDELRALYANIKNEFNVRTRINTTIART